MSQAFNSSFVGSFFSTIKKRLKHTTILKIRGFDLQDMVACTMVDTRLETPTQQPTGHPLARKYSAVDAGPQNSRRGYEMTDSIFS